MVGFVVRLVFGLWFRRRWICARVLRAAGVRAMLSWASLSWEEEVEVDGEDTGGGGGGGGGESVE